MAGFIGAQPLTKASYEKRLVIATAGQTTFPVSYNPNFLDVLVNGVEMNVGDYTATNGTSVVFGVGLLVADEVTFKIWGTFNPADTYSMAEVDGKDDYIISMLSKGTDVYSGAYGVTWHSDTDTYVRTGTPGVTSIQSLMKRCVLNTNGTVNYFLNPSNSGYKEDGTVSVLDGTAGNVMVQVPKFYVKYTDDGVSKSVEISLTADAGFVVHPAFVKAGVEVAYRYYRAYTAINQVGVLHSVSGVIPTVSQTIATFRTQARANGAGWEMVDWNLLSAIQALGFVEFADFQWDRYIGAGNNVGADYGITTGQSNGIGNSSSPSTNNGMWMSYRGIENFYADVWEFTDGVNFTAYVPYINSNHTTFASDVFTGDYVSSGVTMPAASGSYIKNINVGSTGFIPTSVTGGSSTTYVGDGLWTAAGNTIAVFGGSAGTGALGGAFCLNASYASSISSAGVGAGLSY